MLLLLALSLPGRASPPAWYHPDQVAQDSALFQRSSELLGPRYDTLDSQLRLLSPAIEELELSADLGADLLPPATRQYAVATRKAGIAAHIAAQQQVDRVQDGYGRSFGAALDRALATVGKDYAVKQCAGGGGVQAMAGHSRSCAGEDLNAALARAIDADPQLPQEIAAINAEPWPPVQVAGASQPVVPLTGTAGFVRLGPVAQALWKDRLESRSDALDRAVAPLDDAIAGGDAAAMKTAQEQRAAYERKLAADGQVLTGLLAETLGHLKKGAGANVGFCVNPAVLGGCPGTDRTEELLPLLVADKKLAKALDALP